MAKAAKKKKKKKSKDKSAMRSFIGGSLKWLFVAGLWVALLGGLTLAWFARELPDITVYDTN